MKLLFESWRRFTENIDVDVEVGDVILGGKYKNKRMVVKEIGKDELGQPTVNGKPMLKFRIEKHLPDNKKSKKTLDAEKEEKEKEKLDEAESALFENWRSYLKEAQTFYHGTSDEAGQSIIQNGFSLSNTGARQKALHGKEVVEIGGIYLTAEKEQAKWYAGPDNTKPGMNQGGVVVEVEVDGKVMSEKEWWSIKRELSQKIGGGLYDDEKNKQKNEEAVNQAKEMGYVGFQESTDPNEIIIFDPQSVGAVGAFTADEDEEEL